MSSCARSDNDSGSAEFEEIKIHEDDGKDAATDAARADKDEEKEEDTATTVTNQNLYIPSKCLTCGCFTKNDIWRELDKCVELGLTFEGESSQQTIDIPSAILGLIAEMCAVRTVTLISQNTAYLLTPEAALMSTEVVKGVDGDNDSANVNVVLQNQAKLSSVTLSLVCEWLMHHDGVIPIAIKKPIRSVRLEKITNAWDAEFIDKRSIKQIFSIILTSSQLGIQPLLHLGCAKIATLIKGKSPGEISTILGDNNANRNPNPANSSSASGSGSGSGSSSSPSSDSSSDNSSSGEDETSDDEQKFELTAPQNDEIIYEFEFDDLKSDQSGSDNEHEGETELVPLLENGDVEDVEVDGDDLETTSSPGDRSSETPSCHQNLPNTRQPKSATKNALLRCLCNLL